MLKLNFELENSEFCILESSEFLNFIISNEQNFRNFKFYLFHFFGLKVIWSYYIIWLNLFRYQQYKKKKYTILFKKILMILKISKKIILWWQCTSFETILILLYPYFIFLNLTKILRCRAFCDCIFVIYLYILKYL